jgi:hypothetical protein
VKLLDTLLGRTKAVRADLDALFALPSAAVTLQASCGLVSTRHAGVCFKPPAGQPFAEMQSELEKLLALKDAPAPGSGAGPSTGTLAVRHVGDRFGYRWILIDGVDLDDLVTRVHMVHSSLEDAGWSTQLLCSVFGFAPADASGAGAGPTPTVTDVSGADVGPGDDVSDPVAMPVYLVYLAKQGTFYPFAPRGGEKRDTEVELRLRAVLGADLPVEHDLSRWFPLWDLPVS